MILKPSYLYPNVDYKSLVFWHMHKQKNFHGLDPDTQTIFHRRCHSELPLLRNTHIHFCLIK